MAAPQKPIPEDVGRRIRNLYDPKSCGFRCVAGKIAAEFGPEFKYSHAHIGKWLKRHNLVPDLLRTPRPGAGNLPPMPPARRSGIAAWQMPDALVRPIASSPMPSPYVAPQTENLEQALVEMEPSGVDDNSYSDSLNQLNPVMLQFTNPTLAATVPAQDWDIVGMASAAIDELTKEMPRVWIDAWKNQRLNAIRRRFNQPEHTGHQDIQAQPLEEIKELLAKFMKQEEATSKQEQETKVKEEQAREKREEARKQEKDARRLKEKKAMEGLARKIEEIKDGISSLWHSKRVRGAKDTPKLPTITDKGQSDIQEPAQETTAPSKLPLKPPTDIGQSAKDFEVTPKKTESTANQGQDISRKDQSGLPVATSLNEEKDVAAPVVSAINNPGDNTQSRQVPNPSPDTPPSPTPLQPATIANDTNQLAGTQPLIANNQAVQPPPPVNTPCSKLPCPGPYLPPSPPETREGQKFYGPINQPNMQGGVMPAGLNAPVKPASNAGLIFAIGVSVVAGIGIAAAYFLIPEVRQCVDSHIIHPIRNALPATSDATFTRPQQNSSSGYGRVNDPNRPVIF